ncbi:MAG: hypothetical protein RR382_00560 [Tannerellaceae bacterium]
MYRHTRLGTVKMGWLEATEVVQLPRKDKLPYCWIALHCRHRAYERCDNISAPAVLVLQVRHCSDIERMIRDYTDNDPSDFYDTTECYDGDDGTLIKEDIYVNLSTCLNHIYMCSIENAEKYDSAIDVITKTGKRTRYKWKDIETEYDKIEKLANWAMTNNVDLIHQDNKACRLVFSWHCGSILQLHEFRTIPGGVVKSVEIKNHMCREDVRRIELKDDDTLELNIGCTTPRRKPIQGQSNKKTEYKRVKKYKLTLQTSKENIEQLRELMK